MWYHIAYVFPFLSSLSIIVSRSIHFAANDTISFFLWMSSISSYIYYKEDIYLLYSSVNGHLRCFHVLLF